ncbi:MAG: ABC transporter permease [Candidatus Wallbacteria bacterium]|nr:ABC transporter permease [Candidatus Wallbacteria bacterium]
MNLAARDIRQNLGRFGLTTAGLGLLLMTVMGMGGIYRGLVEDATLLVDRVGADLWLVQKDTRGPFAELSRVPRSLVDRAAAVPGVRRAREFVYHTIQRTLGARALRLAVVGLGWPSDAGQWLPLTAGRPLARGHYEMIADAETGLRLGERLSFGRDSYTVVGLTRGMVSSAGDGLGFFSVNDALAIQGDRPGEALRLERSARSFSASRSATVKTQPALAGWAASLPAAGAESVSAVLLELTPGTDPDAVLASLAGWGDVTAYTRKAQVDLLLQGTVDRSRRQIGLFRALLTVISTIIMALILYTLTLDKLHSIAVLKLIGAPSSVIVRMILEQALLMGGLGLALAYGLGQKLFPRFPRRVILTGPDLAQLCFIVFCICVVASLLGIWRALRVRPSEALAG